MTMTIEEFFSQCDDATLKYIEESLLPKMIRIDKLNKMKNDLAKIKELSEEGTK